MNLAQAVDPETLLVRESGVRGAFAAAVRETLGRVADALGPWWKRPEAPVADRLRLRKGSAKAAVVRALEEARRPLSYPELQRVLSQVSRNSIKQALFELHTNGQIVRHGACKSYRYGLPR